MLISERIEINDKIRGGKLIIRGMRITVQTILELLSNGDKSEDILISNPMLEAEDIASCLSFASKLMNRKFSISDRIEGIN